MDLRAKQKRWAFRLRTKVIGIITGLLVVMMICGGLIVNCQFSEQLKEQFKELGSVMTRSMASTSIPNLLYQGQESKQLDYIKNVMAEYQDIQYVLVLRLVESGDRNRHDSLAAESFPAGYPGSQSQQSPQTWIQRSRGSVCVYRTGGA